MKRIICLILVAVTLLSLIASGIAIMVNAADTTTTSGESTEPGDTTTTGNDGGQELKNGDKIIVFILGAIVPCIIFIVMIVKVTWGRK